MTVTIALPPKNMTIKLNKISQLQKIINKTNKELSQMIEIYRDFEKTNMTTKLSGKFIKHENSLFLVHDNFVDLKKTRTMRSGFLLGDIKNNKFKPSQNLAKSLSIKTFKNILNFDKNDENVLKYLKGETIDKLCNDGYVLICVDNFPLGFGLCRNNKIKNKLSKSMIF